MKNIPLGYCQCGCGARTNIAPNTWPAAGRVKGRPYLFINGHNRRKSPVEYIVNPDTGCWEWQLTTVNGRGQKQFRNRLWLAHRVYWVMYRGEIGDGLCVCHKCDNPGCVNPDHLFLGTHSDNMEDMWNKGRGYTKLTPDQARAIFMMRDKTGAEISRLFGISKSTANRIKRGALHKRDTLG